MDSGIVNYFARLRFLVESHALFTGLASTEKRKSNFKTGSHDTINTFKNYFATIFLVSVFSNKRYPNKPKQLVCVWEVFRVCVYAFCWKNVGPKALFTDPKKSSKHSFNINLGPTILFTHLKIILLQCFEQ